MKSLSSLLSKQKQINIFYVLVGLSIATIPLDYGINSVSLIIMSVFWIILLFQNNDFFHLKNKQNYLWLALLGTFYLLSYFWSIEKDYSLKGLTVKVPLMLFPFIFHTTNQKISTLNINTIFRLFILSIIIVDIVCFYKSFQHYMIYNDLDVFFYHKLSGQLNLNAIYLSCFNGLCLFILLTTKQFNNKALSIFAFIILVVFLFLLSSKMVIFSFIVAVISAKLMVLKSNKKIVGIFLVSFIGLFIVIGSFSDVIKNRVNEVFETEISKALNNDDLSDLKVDGISIRIFQYRAFTEIIKENSEKSIVGFGLKAYKIKLNEKYKKYNIFFGYDDIKGVKGLDFHNQYVSTFLSIGVVGFFFLLAFIISCVFQSVRTKDEFLFSVSVFFTMIFLSEMYLETQRGVVIFSLIMLIALNRNSLYISKKTAD